MSSRKVVLFLVNHDVVIYNFRLEIVEKFIEDGHEVHVSSPYGTRINALISLGVKFHEITFDRRSINILKDIKIIKLYKQVIQEIKPDIIFGFTIKPNIYGAIAARRCSVPFVANITGLGTALASPGIIQKLLVIFYRYAFIGIRRIFFQNKENRQFFKDYNIAVNTHTLVPGSGVNLQRYKFRNYPMDKIIRFAFISRIMKEKGIEQYLEAAEKIKGRYKNVEFHVCGFCESEYNGKLTEKCKRNIIIFHGMINNVPSFIEDMHCIVHPSYYPEGISNILLEACAIGRPIITTDNVGCREVIEDGKNGFIIPPKDTESLICAIEKFLKLSYEEKQILGSNARKYVEKYYDRQIVVERYVNELESINYV